MLSLSRAAIPNSYLKFLRKMEFFSGQKMGIEAGEYLLADLEDQVHRLYLKR